MKTVWRWTGIRGGLWSLAGLWGMTVPWGPEAAAQTFNPHSFTLDNGLQVVVIENHRAPVVTHMLWYKAGSADEAPGKSGVAHLLEHLMFKGTDSRAPGAFSAIVARHGGHDNAFTSSDYTAYFQTVAADRLGLVMELEADRMVNLSIPAAEFEPERRVVLEERRSRVENSPDTMLEEQVRALTWLNHPYRLPIIGWAHEIAALTIDDVMAFYRRWYAPNNAVLVVAGAVTAPEVRALAETHYGPVPARPVPARTRPAEPEPVAPRQVVMLDGRAASPTWTRNHLAPSAYSETAWYEPVAGQAEALQVLAEALGGDSTGILYDDLVIGRARASDVGAFYHPGSRDLTVFGFWLIPHPDVALEDAVDDFEARMTTLLADGIPPAEVARAKQRLIDSAIFAADDLDMVAEIFGAALGSGGTIEDVESWTRRIQAVTPQAVLDAARVVLGPSEGATTGILLPDMPDPDMPDPDMPGEEQKS